MPDAFHPGATPSTPDAFDEAPPLPGTEPTADGLAARRAALALVEAALARRGGFDEARGAPAFSALAPRDRAFAVALAQAVMRSLGPVDALLAARIARSPPPAVTALLRLGAAQILSLKAPPHAAVATTLALAEAERGTRAFKGLINAVLRGLVRDPPAEAAPAAYLPAWLYARWSAAYGEAHAEAIARRIAGTPPTDLSLRDPADAERLAPALDAVRLTGGGLRTARRGSPSEWPGYAEGRWWVQDAAAALAARALGVQPGETVLDLCAAPGGKTLQLAAAGAHVIAVDRSAARLRRLQTNLDRIGVSDRVEIVAAEAAAWCADAAATGRRFDAVLLDAPCTATGTFRRHPDVLWQVRPADIAALAAVQAGLLRAAAPVLRPGGRLVYSVCSLEPEEGEGQVAAFLAGAPGFKRAPLDQDEAKRIGAPAEALTPLGDLRCTPGLPEPAGGLDGFFVAGFVATEP